MLSIPERHTYEYNARRKINYIQLRCERNENEITIQGYERENSLKSVSHESLEFRVLRISTQES